MPQYWKMCMKVLPHYDPEEVFHIYCVYAVSVYLRQATQCLNDIPASYFIVKE